MRVNTFLLPKNKFVSLFKSFKYKITMFMVYANNGDDDSHLLQINCCLLFLSFLKDETITNRFNKNCKGV